MTAWCAVAGSLDRFRPLTSLGLTTGGCLQRAREQGCSIIFFPECFAFIGTSSEESLEESEPLTGATMQKYCALAEYASPCARMPASAATCKRDRLVRTPSECDGKQHIPRIQLVAAAAGGLRSAPVHTPAVAHKHSSMKLRAGP